MEMSSRVFRFAGRYESRSLLALDGTANLVGRDFVTSVGKRKKIENKEKHSCGLSEPW